MLLDDTCQIYFRLKDISGCKNFSIQDQGVHKIAKKAHVEGFFQFLMLNISSIKELLHKSSESSKYDWNSTRKTKNKSFLDFILQYVTPRNHKNVRNCYFGGYLGGLGTNVEFNGFL